MNNYILTTNKKRRTSTSIRALYGLIAHEKKAIATSVLLSLITVGLNLLIPFFIGVAIDRYIIPGNYSGLLRVSALLLGIFILGFGTQYIQTASMGGIAQRMLYTLKKNIFEKLQQLPTMFFNQNKQGDLIARINNDTNKINQFFSQSLIQLISTIVSVIGISIFIIITHTNLALVALAPALGLLVITRVLSPLIKKRNAETLASNGRVSAEVQESLNNFKVTIAFNRQDYFEKNFLTVNESNYRTAVRSSTLNNSMTPLYDIFTYIAQLAVLVYGILLIREGSLSIGVLVSFLAYISRLYDPLRQLAAIWTSFQVALAGWDRINSILLLENDMPMLSQQENKDTSAAVAFEHVSFTYPGGKEVLKDLSFSLERGKKYAFVGPTGGGKTTTASLISRLFDPTEGVVYLFGKDIRTLSNEERSETVSMLLQDPFLFVGTVGENIAYGLYEKYDKATLETRLQEEGLSTLIDTFEQGLDTTVGQGGNGISLGQKQIICFMRTILRKPPILILDEATANIDTVTEKLLETIVETLPKNTTIITIAHRLNTIATSDEIFFVNDGTITPAGSFDHAVEMIMKGKRAS